MEFEVLHRSRKKQFIIAGVVVVLVLAAIVFSISFARYRVVQSVQIASGTINYVPYDFNIIAMYQENDDGGYDEVNTMPSASSFTINTERSYCTVNGANDNNAVLETIDGHHTIANLQKGSKCYLYFDQGGGNAADVILAGRTVQTRNFPITTSTKVEGTNNQGDIYQAQDDDGTTYYFAGNPDDNWVSFAGHYWRIIRINGDGTIRLIYSGTGSAQTTGTGTQVTVDGANTSAFNSSYNASYYVGLKYTANTSASTGQHGTTTESTILQKLNTWYTSNISSTYRDKIDTNAGFCGDREMDSNTPTWVATGGEIYYAAYERLVRTSSNVNPTFKCENSSDLYTVSGANKGNKSLTNPVGLITADEVIYGGLPRNGSITNNYLYTGQYYWTLSPWYFFGSGYACVFFVNSYGYLNWGSVDGTGGVRPVINLKADVSLSGSGTASDPYVVSS